ncbi:MAG TPA: matrixin family metalloprotease [Blastocatellia bacterium]|nr:matrixin family metalloprotease [Blastocatellia bacterium]
MRRNSHWLGLFLAFICLNTLPAAATTVVMLPDTDLIVSSRLIVTGQVVSVVSAWDDRGSMAWTYVEVLTDRVLKGESETTIVLKQMGGTVGESGIYIPGQPRFAPGERVLLYLNSAKDGSLHSAHAFVGKFSIVRDSAGREFVERSIDSRDVQFLLQANDSEITNRAPLDSYLETIRETLRREANRAAEIDGSRAGEPVTAVPAEYARKKQQSRGYAPEFVLFGGGVRWMEADSGQAISYNLNTNASPVAGGGSAEVTRAMSAWSGSGAGIRLLIANQTGNCGIVFDNSNTISFGDCMNQLDPPVGCAGVAALTAFSWTREFKVIGGTTFSRLIETDTIFNKGMECFLGNSANLAEVACHELGHSIGLDHSTDASAIMWYQAHGRGRDATLAADDRAGALAIYPTTGGGGGPGPAPGAPVIITSLSASDGVRDRQYSSTLTASGGIPPYRWSLISGTLPPALSLSTNGTIAGIPTAAGSYTFAVQVFDSGSPVQSDAKWLSIKIRESGGSSGAPSITRVKLKGSRKLRIFGLNFRANSLIVINGLVYQPTSYEQGGSEDNLFLKKRLQLGPEGTNIVVVSNTDNSSAPFFF